VSSDLPRPANSPLPKGPPPAPKLDARGLPVGYTLKPDWEVTPRDAKAKLHQPEATRPVLLDCRRPEEWAFNRIDGAVHIPMNEIEARLDELDELTNNRQRPIIVQCHHGVRSLRVTATLRAHGFKDVVSLAGGIDLWSMDVDPSVPRY
jgi:rhodanese-related sulfurtransferase